VDAGSAKTRPRSGLQAFNPSCRKRSPARPAVARRGLPFVPKVADPGDREQRSCDRRHKRKARIRADRVAARLRFPIRSIDRSGAWRRDPIRGRGRSPATSLRRWSRSARCCAKRPMDHERSLFCNRTQDLRASEARARIRKI